MKHQASFLILSLTRVLISDRSNIRAMLPKYQKKSVSVSLLSSSPAYFAPQEIKTDPAFIIAVLDTKGEAPRTWT